jgi:glycosyltransferase involved in cell wall biosynthesis
MRILQVINFFKPSWESGGPARVVYEISRKLVERSHEVTVYTTDGFKLRLDVEKNKPVDVDGIKTYYFRNLSSYLSREMVLPVPYYLPIVARRETKDFDVVHIHEYRTVLAIVAHHYAKKYGIPYILQPRGSVPTISKIKQKKLFDALFGRSIFKDASKIIASSKIESDQYRDVFPELNDEKIVHIPNGIDLKTYQNLPQKGEFKRKYSINPDEKIILFLSRIHERKGADILIEAFSKLKNEFESIKLVIAGPDEGYLDKLKLIASKLDIESDVMFPGPLYEKDKLEAYVDADIFVLPSKDRYESFGNVVLEALACGTPVIVTNNCGVSEWIGDNVGYVVEYDKDQLWDAMIKVLSDERLRRRFGEEGKRFVREAFEWSRVVGKIEEIYVEGIKNYKIDRGD